MNKLITGIGLVLTGTLLTQSGALAGPILDASTTYGGDTFYLYQGDSATDTGSSAWANAEAFAVGQGQILAVLTSSAEIQAVYNGLINNGPFFVSGGGSQAAEAWLGGYTTAPNFSTTSPYAWAWVNGAPWTAADAANFNAGEPNGDSEGLAINRYGTFTFNDEGGFVGGFITETVPDGGLTISLLGGALVGVGALRRKLFV
jgi:hypothetical protein